MTAAVRAAALGHSAILVDATPRTQFQFTGPTGLFSKALRDAALRMDVGVLRSMGIGDAAIWSQVRSQQLRSDAMHLRRSGRSGVACEVLLGA